MTETTIEDLRAILSEPEPGSMEDIFGPPISVYSRAQAIEDGVLVDITQSDAYQESGFKYPIAMTRAAYAETVERGGKYVPDPDSAEHEMLVFSNGQSVSGRLNDVLTVLRYTSRAQPGPTDRLHFTVKVSGRNVRLWSLCGPGDTPEPTITIMLEGED